MTSFNSGNENDVAVSTRVRIARNIKGIPYPGKMSVSMAEKIINDVWTALDTSPLKNELKLYKMAQMPERERVSLVERHIISPELAKSPIGAVIISNDKSISIMINEEDHLRIQAFTQGLDADGAYTTAKQIETLLGERITYDCDEKFGFLTSCPTNAGTGLRASVMLHLPAITMAKSVNPLLKWAANLGMTVRGLYGEGSKASGALFQLSNQVTLGVSEQEILSRFNAAACSLISEERRISAEIYEKNKFVITDKCLRSLGILKNAYMISSGEATDLISNVCLGANLGIIKNIQQNKLRTAMFETFPSTLNLNYGDLQPEMRDVKRAQILQSTL